MTTYQGKKKLDRERRGQISPEELETCIGFSTEHLIEMLSTDNPQKRTIAATILGNRGDEKAIIHLCTSLKKEKALYSRIAMSEALGKMGEEAVSPLINLLGQIGNNQEIELPKKYFNKKSFPLVRDMAARTIIKMGKPATPYLIKVVQEDDIYISQQAIDALGGIAAKTGDGKALTLLIECLEKYNDDKLTLWKTVRALSAFKSIETPLNPLLNIIENYQEPAIIWETVRTLGQIGISRSDVIDVIQKLEKNDHPEIKRAAKNALINLKNSS